VFSFKYSKSKFSQNTTNLLSIINMATCFDSESSPGQLLNQVLGISSKSAHFWDPKLFTAVRERGCK
jgi:hypothetical protein